MTLPHLLFQSERTLCPYPGDNSGKARGWHCCHPVSCSCSLSLLASKSIRSADRTSQVGFCFGVQRVACELKGLNSLRT